MRPAALPRDPGLPQLALALDAAGMAASFDAALRRRSGPRVTGCRIERVKYRPGRNCTVAYELELHEAGGGSGRQRVAGRFCRAGEAAPREARERPRLVQPTRCRVPAMLLPELELFAWCVPNDPKLAGLAPLCAVVAGKAPPPEVVAALAGRTGAADVEAALVQYVPELRACARFDVTLPASPAARRMFAKTDRSRDGAVTFEVMRALHRSRAQADGRLVTPRPLLWQPASGLLWQEAVAGDPLIERDTCDRAALAAEVGAMLAAFHGTSVPLARSADDALDAQPQRCAALLRDVEPRWTAVLGRLASRLADGAPAVRALPPATLHGDLHPRNVLVADGRLALIDVDDVHVGPAVLDVGAWIADALFRALLAGSPLEPEQAAAARLLRGYRDESRHPVGGPPLDWAVARALLCERAYRCVVNLKPGRFALVPRLLALAEAVAGRGLFDPRLAHV